MKYYYTPVGMAKFQNLTLALMQSNRHCHLCWCKCTMHHCHFGRPFDSCLGSQTQVYYLAIILLGTPRGAEILCPHKNLYVPVYSSFIDICQKLEAIKSSFSEWLDIQTVVQWNITQEEEMSYKVMKTHWGTLNAYYNMNKVTWEA